MRSPLVVGNWKMHGSRAGAAELAGVLARDSERVPSAIELGLCPTFLHIGTVAEAVAGSRVRVGAQDAHQAAEGAYTGAVAARMLAEYGVTYVIVGHSERRQLFGEQDAVVAEKLIAVRGAGLTPILCVGETLKERESGATERVVLSQLDAVLLQAGVDAFSDCVIAYEPVWAIGTGKSASPAEAQTVHLMIREHLARLDAAVASGIRLLYGGSVKPDNAQALFRQADIDGGLVGGASLNADDFIAICKAADS